MSLLENILILENDLCQQTSNNEDRYNFALKLQKKLEDNSTELLAENPDFIFLNGHRLWTNLLSCKSRWPDTGKRCLIIYEAYNPKELNDSFDDIIQKLIDSNYFIVVACKLSELSPGDVFKTYPLANPMYISYDYNTIIECDPYFYLRYDPCINNTLTESKNFKFDIVIAIDYIKSKQLLMLKDAILFIVLINISCALFEKENNNISPDIDVIFNKHNYNKLYKYIDR